jgi:predicted AAA+ superfamily ATPase
MDYDGFLPSWETGEIDLYEKYTDRMKNINSLGYGIYSKYHMFTLKGSTITPVKAPDSIRLSDLKDYESEREAVINNTLALLKGKPAANTLLYGDAGTGKSSTVKAIVNEFGDRGLRLIEVTKKQLTEIPLIMEQLCKNPLKFIIFIDDLSFNSDNEDIGSLKAILEGSASSRTPNVVIYATSNRRHLMREAFSDRGNDDIHLNETIQEQVSLSERFGLSVIFSKPDKRQYLKIVHELVRQYTIKISEQEIDLRAERYALERGGRSPRAARQFVEYLKSIE